MLSGLQLLEPHPQHGGQIVLLGVARGSSGVEFRFGIGIVSGGGSTGCWTVPASNLPRGAFVRQSSVRRVADRGGRVARTALELPAQDALGQHDRFANAPRTGGDIAEVRGQRLPSCRVKIRPAIQADRRVSVVVQCMKGTTIGVSGDFLPVLPRVNKLVPSRG